MSAAAAGELSPQGAIAASAGPPGAACPAGLEPRQGSDPFTRQVRQRFGRGAPHYDQEARLQQAMAWRLARLCRDLPLASGPCADLGAGTGLLSRSLQQQHIQLRQRPPLQLDLCPELLARNPLAGAACGTEAPQRREAIDRPGEAANGAREGPDGPGAALHERQEATGHPNGLVWDLNRGLPEGLEQAALLASSFALQWLEDPASSLSHWCRHLRPGGWLVLAVPTAGSFPQWQDAAQQAGVPFTALALPDAEELRQTAISSGLSLRHGQRLRFSRPRQGGMRALRHLQRLGAGASRRRPLTTGALRRLLAHWPAASPLTWEVLLLIAQRPD
jgi:malonyl-CoA O-methyltransferase